MQRFGETDTRYKVTKNSNIAKRFGLGIKNRLISNRSIIGIIKDWANLQIQRRLNQAKLDR